MTTYLLITIGKTHSGKTTFAKELKERLKQTINIDNDEINIFLKRNFSEIYLNEEIRADVRAKQKFDLKILIQQIISSFAFSYNYSVILSGANTWCFLRKKFIENAHNNNNTKVIGIFFDINTSALEERITNTDRGKETLNSSKNYFECLKKQHYEFQAPEPEEIKLYDYFLQIRNSEDYNRILDQLSKMIKENQ